MEIGEVNEMLACFGHTSSHRWIVTCCGIDPDVGHIMFNSIC
jgi:hypothetical protein